jgi:carbamoyltransferase
MIILGISAFYHDSAAALVIDGEIVSAAQEERFTRIKHDSSFPINAVKFCLQYSNLTLNEIDSIVYYDKPFLTFERSLETFITEAPFGFTSYITSIPKLVKNRLLLKTILLNDLCKIPSEYSKSQKKELRKRLFFCEHHLSHAASAFFPSPFERAIVLTIDGVGEWATTTLATGDKSTLTIEREIHFPHSIGLLYSAFTYYLGFAVNGGEYKVMGLAPYGNDKYSELIKNTLIDILDDGTFHLDMNYFSFTKSNKMINKKFERIFDHSRRLPESELNQFHFDIAKSIQVVIEDVVIGLCKSISKEYNIKNLCLAGGVALNCVANGKLKELNIFQNIWVQPAAGDAGGSVGAALAAYYLEFKKSRTNILTNDSMQGSFLGPDFNNMSVSKFLNSKNVIFEEFQNRDDLNKVVAKLISKGNIIGWHQGRMEFGPRALGNRSIIADPRNKMMQKDLNLKIKFRESFRPFAPAILEEYVADYFHFNDKSPYMLFVAPVKTEKLLKVSPEDMSLTGISKLNINRSTIPAITHVDNSARIQTVNIQSNPNFHSLITEFHKQTGCPILINTSFNVRGEPIVCTPQDSLNCFMNTGIDVLVIENFVIIKGSQSSDIIFDKLVFAKD